MCALKKFLVTGDVEGNLNYHDLDQFNVQKKVTAHFGGINMIKEGQENKFMTSSEDFKAKIWMS